MSDPFSMASIGSFMSGAGSFLGGLGIGGKQKRPSYRPYMKAMGLPKGASLVDAQKLQIQGDFDARMAAAEKHGLHPLTALGVSTSQASPTAYLPGSSGPDLEAMGQGIDRMANAGRSGMQRKLDELALEQATLSNDYLRVQIAGAQKAIAESSATIPMDGGDTAGNFSPKRALTSRDLVELVRDKQTTKNPNDSGRTAGDHAGFMTIDLGDGRYAEVPKTDEGWAEAIGELPFFYKYPKMAEIMGKRAGNKLRKTKVSKKWLAPWDPRRWKK